MRQDGLIDLHAHVLPGLDDGARDIEEAVGLARAAAAQGTRVLAATPHMRADHPTVHVAELAERTSALSEALAAAEIDLELVVGGEVDLDWAGDASDEALDLVSYGQRGKDLLLEVPYGPLAPDFEERLDAVRARGFRLLLAHPERNPSLRETPERVADLVDDGFLVQVTARALAPANDASATRQLARTLVEQGLVHVLASDAHGPAEPAPPDLAVGVRAAREIVGPRAEWMSRDAPAAVLAGAPLPPAVLRRPVS